MSRMNTTTHGDSTRAATPRDEARDRLMAAIDAAALANPMVRTEDGREHVLVPEGFTLKDVTDPHRHPVKPAAAQITVDDRASLVAYAKRHMIPNRSAIFADYDAGTITARLDWHPDNDATDFPKAGPDRHRVTLKMRDSLEWQRWSAMQGKMVPQATFARFLEENASDICFPDPATFIEIARDLEATSGMTFKAGTRLQNGDREFLFTEESRVVSKTVVPEEMHLMIPLYLGEEAEEVATKFRWKADPGGLLLGFVWHRTEYMRQARFNLIAATAAEETGLPFCIGRITG